MSKSRGNVVGPDEYVRRHGSDVLRCALLFSAPWEQGGDFVDDALGGVERFFTRVWKLVVGGAHAVDEPGAVDAAIRRATTAIEKMRFNVALSACMELTGHLVPGEGDAADVLVRLLAPLAPHLAEELWARIGGTGSVHLAAWPEPESHVRHEVELVVQVDGRVRDRVALPVGLDEAAARGVVHDRPKVLRALGERAVVRVVHVPDRVINLVTTGVGEA
jgi:leucyl-tRNA synthetase